MIMDMNDFDLPTSFVVRELRDIWTWMWLVSVVVFYWLTNSDLGKKWFTSNCPKLSAKFVRKSVLWQFSPFKHIPSTVSTQNLYFYKLNQKKREIQLKIFQWILIKAIENKIYYNAYRMTSLTLRKWLNALLTGKCVRNGAAKWIENENGDTVNTTVSGEWFAMRVEWKSIERIKLKVLLFHLNTSWMNRLQHISSSMKISAE